MSSSRSSRRRDDKLSSSRSPSRSTRHTDRYDRHYDRRRDDGRNSRRSSRQKRPLEHDDHDNNDISHKKRTVAFGERTKALREEKQRKEEAKKNEIRPEMTPEEMMAAMGLPTSFDSTKGKKVEDEASNMCASRTYKQREFKQTMNIRRKALPADAAARRPYNPRM